MGTTRPGQPLQKISDYLRRNFPDFFAEARFQVGDDDYYLYARFGAYLARAIEQKRTPRGQINRGFTVLNKMANAASSPSPTCSSRALSICTVLLSGKGLEIATFSKLNELFLIRG